MMLLGMGLLKLRVFSATRSIRFYVVMAAVGYGIGLPRRGYWVYEALTHNFDLVHYLDSSLHFWSNAAGSRKIDRGKVCIDRVTERHEEVEVALGNVGDRRVGAQLTAPVAVKSLSAVKLSVIIRSPMLTSTVPSR